jgi:predicted nucleotidyltransferase
MTKIQEHWEEANRLFPPDRIVGVFCQGSQNYLLSDEHSDMDTKCIICPSFEDFVNAKEIQKNNFTHYRANQEHISFIDVRNFIKLLKEGMPNYLELLYTNICVINPKYELLWAELVNYRDKIARYNEPLAVKSMNRIVQSKTQNLQAKKTYPSRMYLMKDWEYDPKELSHALRVFYLLKDYCDGKDFYSSLLGVKGTEKEEKEIRELIIKLKREPFLTYKEALDWGQKIAAAAQDIASRYAEQNPYWYGNKEVEKVLHSVRKGMMLKGIEKEIANED